jgi:ribosomal protein S18 acetylase RimI-like enzyme
MPTFFPLIYAYFSALLGYDLAALQPGVIRIHPSRRRLLREESYSFRQPLWWLWLTDGRSLVSVMPGAEAAVAPLVAGVETAEMLHQPELAAQLRGAIDPLLRARRLPVTDRAHVQLILACNAHTLRRHPHRQLRRLIEASIPPVDGLSLATHCFPDGLVYGIVAGGRVVSVAYAHRTRLMEDRVADLGVETAAAYRRRGHARAAVSAVAADMIERGGEAVYSLNPDNAASLATARSAGFGPFATGLYLGAPLRHP